MSLKISYIDTNIIFSDKVNSIEIDNKAYFYRLVNDFNILSNGELANDLYFYDCNNEEINLTSKINLFLDYFNIDFTNKKYASALNKAILDVVDESDINKLTNYYDKIRKEFESILSKVDLSLIIDSNFDINNLIKLVKVGIAKKDDLFNNLLLIIDIEKSFNINKLIVFVNLKQYLSKEELVELYKYSIYNNINILLIDSQIYKMKISNEKLLIIDKDLNEFVV